MGKHADVVTERPQDMLIRDLLDRLLRKEIETHPRRFTDVRVGTEFSMHVDRFNRSYTGMVVTLDPLRVTWRY